MGLESENKDRGIELVTHLDSSLADVHGNTFTHFDVDEINCFYNILLVSGKEDCAASGKGETAQLNWLENSNAAQIEYFEYYNDFCSIIKKF